jgi:hypothetical protein
MALNDLNRSVVFLLAALSVPATFAATAPPGVVIDHSPARSKQYIGSPSIAVLPSGEYVASHDFFGPGSTRDTTVLFASKDRGKTWQKRATLQGQWWSTLFVHRKGCVLRLRQLTTTRNARKHSYKEEKGMEAT